MLFKAGRNFAFFTLAGCSSKVAETEQYSGFMSDYSDLQTVETSSGHQVLRWVSPDFRLSNYKDIYLSPVVYFPSPVPDSRVSAATLEQIRLYTEQRLKSAVSSHKQLSSRPHEGGLMLRTAITAVSAENKDIQFYEVLPVTAVIAGTMTVTGKRSQNTFLFIEAVLTDVSTNKPVIKVVRKAYGSKVSNSESQITQNDIKSAIDIMVADIVDFPGK
ncbi:DUF3313 domain-containing protein [Candidatus Pantoea bituminis]|uniref:DUF3313 domain-containing protein n=1 Tax=Candidatus Pantoea bituminis TaxID=2831036 RepID=UPI00281221A5|nr:DUF3313 domain-containing protein [Pantoea bituminis]